MLRELRRNPALLTLCEFDPVPLQSPPKKVLERVDGVLRVNSISQPQRSTIPDSHNLKLVVQMEQKQGLIAAMIPTLRAQLMAVLPSIWCFSTMLIFTVRLMGKNQSASVPLGNKELAVQLDTLFDMRAWTWEHQALIRSIRPLVEW